jgi:catechol 2,3-dioxygenase-like lactoylglutathione lyase family enzyme
VFDHITIRVSDVAASERFYDTVLGAIGIGRTSDTGGLPEWDDFSLAAADMAFEADDETVQAFHAALTGAGHPDNGGPGERAEYHPGYYAAFVLDPDGNNIELVDHHRDDEPS